MRSPPLVACLRTELVVPPKNCGGCFTVPSVLKLGYFLTKSEEGDLLLNEEPYTPITSQDRKRKGRHVPLHWKWCRQSSFPLSISNVLQCTRLFMRKESWI